MNSPRRVLGCSQARRLVQRLVSAFLRPLGRKPLMKSKKSPARERPSGADQNKGLFSESRVLGTTAT